MYAAHHFELAVIRASSLIRADRKSPSSNAPAIFAYPFLCMIDHRLDAQLGVIFVRQLGPTLAAVDMKIVSRREPRTRRHDSGSRHHINRQLQITTVKRFIIVYRRSPCLIVYDDAPVLALVDTVDDSAYSDLLIFVFYDERRLAALSEGALKVLRLRGLL